MEPVQEKSSSMPGVEDETKSGKDPVVGKIAEENKDDGDINMKDLDKSAHGMYKNRVENDNFILNSLFKQDKIMILSSFTLFLYISCFSISHYENNIKNFAKIFKIIS